MWWAVVLAATLVAAASAIVRAIGDPRITWPFVWKSLLGLAFIFAYDLAGPAGLYLLLSRGSRPTVPDSEMVGVVVALIAWEVLGIVLLMRIVPRTQEPPRWLMRFGVLDVVCGLAVMWGVARAVGAL